MGSDSGSDRVGHCVDGRCSNGANPKREVGSSGTGLVRCAIHRHLRSSRFVAIDVVPPRQRKQEQVSYACVRYVEIVQMTASPDTMNRTECSDIYI